MYIIFLLFIYFSFVVFLSCNVSGLLACVRCAFSIQYVMHVIVLSGLLTAFAMYYLCLVVCEYRALSL